MSCCEIWVFFVFAFDSFTLLLLAYPPYRKVEFCFEKYGTLYRKSFLFFKFFLCRKNNYFFLFFIFLKFYFLGYSNCIFF